ncbi:putative ribonuclease H-like domain-containing protein [Tanacetum coccineum]
MYIMDSFPSRTGNYMPPLADLSFAGLDDSVYRPTTNKTSVSVSQVETSNTLPSNTSVEMPRVESVRPNRVIIEDWVSDDEGNIFQSEDSQTTVKPSFKKIELTKARNETVKSDNSWESTTSFKVTKDYIDGGFVAFGGSTRGGKITCIGNPCKRFFIKLPFENDLLVLLVRREQHKASLSTEDLLLVVTDDFSRFSWIFFLATKSETSGILKKFITEIENQLNHKVKVIRCDNGTEFKTREMNEFCRLKGIKREFSVARIPQQNGVAERKNRTLIEAARTMLADSLLPTVFWNEAVNTAYYVRNRVLVTKPHNKTPYELIIGRPPSISPQEANGNTGLKKSVDARQSEEKNVSTQQYIVFPLWSSISLSHKSSDEKNKNNTDDDAAGESPVQKPASVNEQALKNVLEKMIDQEKEATEQLDAARKKFKAQCNRELLQGKATKANITNCCNIVSTPVNDASAPRTSNYVGPSFVSLGGSFPLDVNDFPDEPLMPDLEDTAEVQNTGIFGSAFDDEDLDTYNSPFTDKVISVEADFNNMEPSTVVSPIPTTRVCRILVILRSTKNKSEMWVVMLERNWMENG